MNHTNRIEFPRPRAELSAEQRQWIQWVDMEGWHCAVRKDRPPELWLMRVAKGQWKWIVRCQAFDSAVSETTWKRVAEEVDEVTKTEAL